MFIMMSCLPLALRRSKS
ncbi:hypothetical protein RDI58_033582 [Solanum bulbocastanum]